MSQLGARIGPELDAHLTARGDRADIARRTLERAFACLAWERRRLRQLLTPEECCVVVDAFRGTVTGITGGDLMIAQTLIPHLDHEVEDALADGLAEKWGADGPALVEKLRQLDYGASWALLDAVERLRVTKGEAARLLEEPSDA